jgi:hypothetical protein
MNKHLKNNNNTHSNYNIDKTPTYLQQSYIDEKPRFTKTCLEFSNP